MRFLIPMLMAASSVVAQTQAGAALVCPPANQAIRDPATFTWSKGENATGYRLLVGPEPGSSRDGDSSVISSVQGQLAGFPAGENLYVTLWSYDQSGNALQPPSYCRIRTAAERPALDFKEAPQTTLTGVSLGTFPPIGTEPGAQGCQAQCKLNMACQGFTYYPAANGNAAMCDLKSEIKSTDSNACCVSAMKTVTQAVVPTPGPVTISGPAPALGPGPVSGPGLTVTPPAVSSAARGSNTARAAAPPAPARQPAPASLAPEPPPPPPPSSSSSSSAASSLTTTGGTITGDWVNQAGAVSRIVQKGSAISGTYSDPMLPSLTGTIEGTFDGRTLRATLNWKNGRDSSHGALLLDLTPLGRLEGTWTDASGNSGLWSMGPKSASPAAR